MVESKRTPADARTEPHLGGWGEGQSDPRDIADPDAEITIVPTNERYEGGALLGEGGMGQVRLCRDLVIGREVAMKGVLASHADRPEMRARFAREARVQGQLEHPAIVPVYDFGLDGEGHPFFTMRRVRGVTLERVFEALRRGDEATERMYTRHRLLAAFVQVCLAIDFAHERGVLHRDLKPANVMLGGYGEVYVLDWGLAKVRSASRTIDPRLEAARAKDQDPSVEPIDEKPSATNAGAILGTPGYMSPEQISGAEVDARSDVYVLGAILFELLTLQPLHGTGTYAAMLSRALDGAEARPSVRTPGRDVAPELEAACVRACARRPEKRFASARELADAVEAYLSGDRDMALRKDLARTHLDRARAAAAKADASSGAVDERRAALREVSRALALAPDEPEALALFVRIVTEPPKEPPPEVLEEIERAGRASRRRMLPRASLAYAGTWLFVLPIAIAMGIKRPLFVVLPAILWVVAAIAARVAYKYDHTTKQTFPYLTIAAGVALATTSLLHGAFLVIPAIGAVIAMGMNLQTPRRNRGIATAVNVLAVVGPILLTWAGLHPSATHFVDGNIVIVPAALQVPSAATFAYFAALHGLIVVVAARFAGAYRDSLTAVERRSYTQQWQLRQLVPQEAEHAMKRSLPLPHVSDPRLPDDG